MAANLTEEELARLEALEAAATPGPWRSMRDGNQYINTRFLPTAKLVGASRLDGVTRPWNPNKYVTFGFKPEEFETARFKDADADFIAAMRNALPALLASARAVRNESENSSRLSAIREAVRLEKAFLVECRGVREDQEVDEREDFVALLERYLNAPPGGYPHEQAITATAEPTDGEKR